MQRSHRPLIPSRSSDLPLCWVPGPASAQSAKDQHHQLAPMAARLDLPVEEWPYLDEALLLKTRSRKVCMTCHWFRHQLG